MKSLGIWTSTKKVSLNNRIRIWEMDDKMTGIEHTVEKINTMNKENVKTKKNRTSDTSI